jgi:hypothetical protein
MCRFRRSSSRYAYHRVHEGVLDGVRIGVLSSFHDMGFGFGWHRSRFGPLSLLASFRSTYRLISNRRVLDSPDRSCCRRRESTNPECGRWGRCVELDHGMWYQNTFSIRDGLNQPSFILPPMKSPPQKKKNCQSNPRRCRQCPDRPLLSQCVHTAKGLAFLKVNRRTVGDVTMHAHRVLLMSFAITAPGRRHHTGVTNAALTIVG